MSFEIRPASERDIPDLCDLWRSCFPDPEEYVRYFYEVNFSRITVPALFLDGKPVSAIHLLDAVLSDGGQDYPVRYVYAVGTHPDFRMRGYAREVLLDAARAADEGGYGLFLKPSPQMTDAYASLGFATDSRLFLCTFRPGPGEPEDMSVSSLSAPDYNRMRNAAFSSRPYVRWPDAHVSWCVDENAFCGGWTLRLTLDGTDRFLMACPVNGALRVTETDLSPEELTRAAPALCRLSGTSRLEAYLPEDTVPGGISVISSCVYHAPLRHSYANLLLI